MLEICQYLGKTTTGTNFDSFTTSSKTIFAILYERQSLQMYHSCHSW